VGAFFLPDFACQFPLQAILSHLPGKPYPRACSQSGQMP
jgi:hypothetical protein